MNDKIITSKHHLLVQDYLIVFQRMKPQPNKIDRIFNVSCIIIIIAKYEFNTILAFSKLVMTDANGFIVQYKQTINE